MRTTPMRVAIRRSVRSFMTAATFALVLSDARIGGAAQNPPADPASTLIITGDVRVPTMARIDRALVCDHAFLDREDRLCVIGIVRGLSVAALPGVNHSGAIGVKMIQEDR